MELTQNTAFVRMFYLGQSSLTPVIQISKAGGAFTDPHAGVSLATEVGQGWYKFSLAVEDTDTLGSLAYAFGSGSMSATFLDNVVAGASGGDPWATTVPGAYSAGQAGFILGTNLDARVSTRLATTGYTAPANGDAATAAAGVVAIDSGLTAGTYKALIPTAQYDALLADIWQKADQIDGQFTYQDALKLALAALVGKLSIVGSVVKIRDTADAVDRVTATTNAAGERTAVTLNVS